MHYQVWVACDGGEDEVYPRPDWPTLSEHEQELDEQGASQSIGLAYIGIFEADSPEAAHQAALDCIKDDEYLFPGA